MKSYADEHIAAVFRTLIKTNNINSIRVSDIIAAGQVNRKTFYYHFHSITDLLLWMLKKDFSVLCLPASNADNWKANTLAVLKIIEADKSFFIPLSNSKYEAELSANIRKIFREHISEFIENCRMEECRREGREIPLSPRARQYIVDYYNDGVLSLMQNWVRNGCRESSEEFVDILDNLTKNTIFNVLKAFDLQENPT